MEGRQDFGRCEGRAKGGNQYGIPYVSDCVASDFTGPCRSSALPIPCGDRTCRSTFVDCLRALLRIELAQRGDVSGGGGGGLDAALEAHEEAHSGRFGTRLRNLDVDPARPGGPTRVRLGLEAY